MMAGPSWKRGLLWGLLVAVLIAVFAATVVQRLRRPEPPPVLGQVPEFSLTNRDGRTVRRQDLAGSPWVADFIFSRCPASCPIMTARMAKLNRELPEDLGVRMVSITVDPDHDTPQVLQRYAQSFSAPESWLFLTGGKEELFRLSKEGFKLGVEINTETDAIEPILHSTRFVLVDGEGRIRGYYDGFDEESMGKLEKDLRAITR
ncbi:MAG TPA: SCO family protein [Thermoanaerobaculia bacterium]|nr:SCO family protein [Thermoanaerobaculia bacterium]